MAWVFSIIVFPAFGFISPALRDFGRISPLSGLFESVDREILETLKYPKSKQCKIIFHRV
jgi:hypothetical protein